MRIRNMSRCLRVTSVVGLICPASVIAVPPPGARSAQGLTIARQITATQPLSMNSAPADVSTTGGDAFGVTLLSHVPVADFGGGSTGSNDCWGYVSDSGREYALMGLSNQLAFVEITDPASPVWFASIPHGNNLWGDVKVYQDYAYFVTEGVGMGIQVIDMTDLDNHNVSLVRTLSFPGFNHNVVVDTDSGYLYTCGSHGGSDTTVIFDLNSDPSDPVQVGTWNGAYEHDAQVVTYTSGPYAGR